MNIFAKILLMFAAALGILLYSCTSDHEHFLDYNPDVNAGYYFHEGYYYADANFSYKYSFDANHYYFGRLEWKGGDFGYSIVMRENPYYGLVCKVENASRLFEQLGNVYDREVMVRYDFVGDFVKNGSTYPLVHIHHIYYK